MTTEGFENISHVPGNLQAQVHEQVSMHDVRESETALTSCVWLTSTLTQAGSEG